MKKSESGAPSRIALKLFPPSTVLSVVLACNNLEPLPDDDIEYEMINIMPNTNGQILDKDIPIQGSWYWYNNLGSHIDRIKAVAADATPHIWYASDAGQGLGPDDSDTASGGGSSPVTRVCVSGNLGRQDDPEGYFGIGFDLCTTDDASMNLKQFPYTVGTCPIWKKEALLRRFLGVSFKVTPMDSLPFPPRARLMVQFKERGRLDDNQPYCVIDPTGSGAEPNEQECKVDIARDGYLVQAWHGEAVHPDRTPDSGTAKRNLWALQGIHFEVKSDEPSDFSFCLEEVSVIASVNERGDESHFGEEVKIDQDIQVDTDQEIRTSLETVTEAGTDGPSPWVKAREDEQARESNLREDMAYDLEIEDFWIMKEEVSAAQFSECLDTGICKDKREWDSCTPYRYGKAIQEGNAGADDWGRRSANCATWQDAKRFCRWIGGELPSKRLWEYAARSGYRAGETVYPWGNEDPLCENAIFYNYQGRGCGNNGVPEPSCELTNKGNTFAGVCDMIGNLWEWVDDEYTTTDEGWLEGYKIIKGGAFDTINITDSSIEQSSLYISQITSAEHPTEPHNPNHIGFRCMKPLNPPGLCNLQNAQEGPRSQRPNLFDP